MTFPTSRWKFRQTLRKMYEERLSYVNENIKSQMAMLGSFIDLKDYKAAVSVQLIVHQDQSEIADLQNKLDLVNDDSCFNQLFIEGSTYGDYPQ